MGNPDPDPQVQVIRGPDQARIQVELKICAEPIGQGPDDPQINPCSALVTNCSF